jgi:hypothetical protein
LDRFLEFGLKCIDEYRKVSKRDAN